MAAFNGLFMGPLGHVYYTALDGVSEEAPNYSSGCIVEKELGGSHLTSCWGLGASGQLTLPPALRCSA